MLGRWRTAWTRRERTARIPSVRGCPHGMSARTLIGQGSIHPPVQGVRPDMLSAPSGRLGALRYGRRSAFVSGCPVGRPVKGLPLLDRAVTPPGMPLGVGPPRGRQLPLQRPPGTLRPVGWPLQPPPLPGVIQRRRVDPEPLGRPAGCGSSARYPAPSRASAPGGRPPPKSSNSASATRSLTPTGRSDPTPAATSSSVATAGPLTRQSSNSNQAARPPRTAPRPT
jgi:hypothetical protein